MLPRAQVDNGQRYFDHRHLPFLTMSTNAVKHSTRQAHAFVALESVFSGFILMCMTLIFTEFNQLLHMKGGLICVSALVQNQSASTLGSVTE